MHVVDLSVLLNQNTPVYPGDPKIEIKNGAVLEKDGYEDHFVSFGTHFGTHIDAPQHMFAGGKALDAFPIDAFVGRGMYIKVINKKFDLESVKKADIKKGDIVLFHTGMSGMFHEEKYFSDFPPIPEEIAQYLVEKQIKMMGVDTCSVDGHFTSFSAHKLLLKNDILIIENLTKLERLEGKAFQIFALPLALQLDGSPARVIAVV